MKQQSLAKECQKRKTSTLFVERLPRLLARAGFTNCTQSLANQTNSIVFIKMCQPKCMQKSAEHQNQMGKLSSCDSCPIFGQLRPHPLVQRQGEAWLHQAPKAHHTVGSHPSWRVIGAQQPPAQFGQLVPGEAARPGRLWWLPRSRCEDPRSPAADHCGWNPLDQ